MSEVQENGIQRAMRVTEELRAQLAAETKRADEAAREVERLREGVRLLGLKTGLVRWAYQGAFHAEIAALLQPKEAGK